MYYFHSRFFYINLIMRANILQKQDCQIKYYQRKYPDAITINITEIIVR